MNQQTEPGLRKWSEIHKYTLEIQGIRPNTALGARLTDLLYSVTFEPEVGIDFQKRQKLSELNFLNDGNTTQLTRVMLEEGEVDW